MRGLKIFRGMFEFNSNIVLFSTIAKERSDEMKS